MIARHGRYVLLRAMAIGVTLTGAVTLPRDGGTGERAPTSGGEETGDGLDLAGDDGFDDAS